MISGPSATTPAVAPQRSLAKLDSSPARRRCTRPVRDEALDWLQLGRTLWRRKLFLFGSVIVVLGLTAAFLGRMPPIYEAEALLMLNQREPRVTEISALLPPVALREDALRAEVLLIRSRGMAERMIDSLDLHTLPEFNPALRQQRGPADWLNTLVLVAARLPEMFTNAPVASSTTALSPIANSAQITALKTRIIENVLSHIGVEPEHTAALRIKFASSDPQLAMLGANTLAELYLGQELETRRSETARLRAFLNQEIERLRASLSKAEQEIQEYRRQHGLIEEQPIDAQQLTQLTTQLALVRAETAQAEAQLHQVEHLLATGAGSSAEQLLQSPVLAVLRAREVEIGRAIAELSSEYGERHPRMVALRNELNSVQQRKRDELMQNVQRMRDEAQVLRSRQASLQSEIGTSKQKLAERNHALVELQALERPADADRQLLETYIARHEQIVSQESALIPHARIISPAVMPDAPEYPRRPLIFGLAFFGSLLAGALLVLGLESLDDTVRSSEQVEDMLGLPALGLVPSIIRLGRRDHRPEDHVLDEPRSPFGEALRSLRTALLLRSAGARPRTVLVTSAIPSEGKTSVAICLARVCAQAGRRTLLVDCDLRCPRLHELTGSATGPGLSDILLRRRELTECLHHDEQSGALFISAGRPVPDPAALLASERMRKILAEAADRYDLVLLDSPPVLCVADARVLGPMADKTLLLVRWGHTPSSDVLMAAKQLIEAGADLAGVVLSQVDLRKHAKYGYRNYAYDYDDDRFAS